MGQLEVDPWIGPNLEGEVISWRRRARRARKGRRSSFLGVDGNSPVTPLPSTADSALIVDWSSGVDGRVRRPKATSQCSGALAGPFTWCAKRPSSSSVGSRLGGPGALDAGAADLSFQRDDGGYGVGERRFLCTHPRLSRLEVARVIGKGHAGEDASLRLRTPANG